MAACGGGHEVDEDTATGRSSAIIRGNGSADHGIHDGFANTTRTKN